jgi:chromate transporter
MYFAFFLMPNLAKGLLTRTELIDAIAVGHSRQPVFSSFHFVGYQINGISGHSFLRWRYPTLICVCCLLNPMVKKNETLNLLPHFWML